MLQRNRPIITFREVDTKNNNIDFDTALIDISNGYYYLANHLFPMEYRKIGVDGDSITDGIANRQHIEYSPSFEQVHNEAEMKVTSEQRIPSKNFQDEAYSTVIEVRSKMSKHFNTLMMQKTHKILEVYKTLCHLRLRTPKDIKRYTVRALDFCHMLLVSVTVWTQTINDTCHSLGEFILNRLKFSQTPVRKISFKSKLTNQKSPGG